MKRILLIDTDTQERQEFKTALEEAGFEVVDAPNGDDGLRRFHPQMCGLVITEIFMPEKDGLEVIRELRQRFSDVGIIAMSGSPGGISQLSQILSADWALEMARLFGVNATLQKPLRREQIVASARQFFQQREGVIYHVQTEMPM